LRWYRRSFGRAVAERRKAAGATQESFGNATRLHRTYVGKLERGEVNVGLDNPVGIAKTLGTTVSELMAAAERIGEL